MGIVVPFTKGAGSSRQHLAGTLLHRSRGGVMDYAALSNDSLRMIYESIRGALGSDDTQKINGEEPRFRIRETPTWREHAGDLETEMLRKGMLFEIIE